MGKQIDRLEGIWDAMECAEKNNCSFVMIGHGKFALIDAVDFERCKHFKWKFDGRYVKSYDYGRPRKLLYLHRFILNAPNGVDVDHKNMVSTDNQRHNLRLCSVTQNNANTNRRSHNKSSEYKGVRRDTRNGHGRYHARIRYRGEEFHLGTYPTAEIAARVYNEKATELFGEFARLNQI